MNNKKLISLCIPTNGVIEWVFPVLESIYAQGVETALYEIVITDNGDNIEFKKKIIEYSKKHSNLIYKETTALPFLNEIEAYKIANGELIKFVNHRTKLRDGTLQKLIEFAENNKEDKPVIYFTNGVLPLKTEKIIYQDFDSFVCGLSYWSSWSTGMAIWKEDFKSLPADISEYNELFPHTTILFHRKNGNKYVIDNTTIFDELPQGKKPKGNYDLFRTFGIEYPGIICDLLRGGYISNKTFCSVAKNNLEFIASLYFDYCVRKRYCSYNLDGLKDMFGVFYTKRKLYQVTSKVILKKVKCKIAG